MKARTKLLGVAMALAGCGDPTPGGAPADAAVDAAPVVAPTPEPSRATLRIQVTGASGWLVTRGRSCAVMEVEREASGGVFERVPLDTGVANACECAAPGAAASIDFQPLSSTTPQSLTWDARGMTVVQRPVTCAACPPTSPRRTLTEYLGALRPVAPGRYRVSVAVARSIPPTCQKRAAGYWCPPNDQVGAPPPGPHALCPGTRASVVVTVPESGEVTVTLPTGG